MNTGTARAEDSTTSSDDDAIVCATDVKMCVDGSYVKRIGEKCEFAACPSFKKPAPNYLSAEARTKAQADLKAKRETAEAEIKTKREAMQSELKVKREALQAEMKNTKTTITKEVQEKRAEIKAEMEAKRAEIETEIKAKRDEIQTEIKATREMAKAKMEDLKTKIKEEKDTAKAQIKEIRITGRENALKRFDTAVEKINNLKVRVGEQITKLAAKGIDTTNTENLVAAVDAKISIIGEKIVAANALFVISTDQLTAENKTALKTLTKEIETLIKDAHKALNDGVKALKDAVKLKIEAERNANPETTESDE